MKLPMTILQELMESSPIINDYVVSMEYLTSSDNLTIKSIINSCYTILIEHIADQGLEFHNLGGVNELLEDYHQAEHLITLYKVFSVEPLTELLSNNPVMYKLARNLVEGDVSDSELIVYILKLFADSNYFPNSSEMYTFLYDKVLSLSIYADSLRKAIANLSIATPDITISAHEITSFVAVLLEEKRFSRRVITGLQSKYSIPDELVSSAINTFRNDLIYSSSFNSIIRCYRQHAYMRIDVIIRQLRRKNRVYAEARQRQGATKITDLECIVNIVTELSNQYMFKIDPDYSFLKAFREDISAILSDIKQLNLSRENEDGPT